MTEADTRSRGTRADGPDRPRPSRSRIAALRVGELRELAASLGIRHSHLTRKAHLVDAISHSLDTDETTAGSADSTETEGVPGQEVRPDGAEQDSIPAPDEPTFPATDPEPDPAVTQPEPDAPVAPDLPGTVTAAEDAVDEAEGGTEPAAEATDDGAATESADGPVADERAADALLPETVTPAEDAVDEAEGGADPQEGPAVQAEVSGESTEDSAAPKSAASHVNAGLTGIAEDLQELQRRETGDAPEAGQHDGTHPVDGEGAERPGRRGRGRGRGRSQNGAQPNGAPQNGQQNGAPQNGQPSGAQQASAADAAPAEEPAAEPQPPQQPARQQNQNQAQNQNRDEQGEGRRSRYRDRKRRVDGDEPEIRDDDVLIPIAGILDVLDNYAFVRTSGYLAGANDVYVSLGQVKKYHLRRGDAVVGAIRQLQEGEQPPRQKYNALVKVDSVNGLPVAEAEHRVEFEKLTPLYPQERLRLETEPGKLTGRVVDVVAPIGKGTRGLVVSPPKAGKTAVLQAIANAVAKNNPEAHLMVVLVDERPEEVTEMQRTVKGEVIASTFDRPAEDHTTAAELAIERAKRLVELGYDVVVLLDSITRLSRAFNLVVPQSGRVLEGGVDAAALYPPKRLFGAARNIENGGSLTIIATALVETGSRTDAVILEEFKDSGTMELRLSRSLADKRVFPAVDVLASGSRREELLMGPDEVRVTGALRRALSGLEQQAALDVVLGKMTETDSNVEFLVQMQKSLPSGK